MSSSPKLVDVLIEILRSEGVDRVFGNPGTTELPLLDALSTRPDLQYVLGLQEASVVAMADGYARATHRPAFVNLHVAAGLANGLIGMLDARRSRTPLVVTAGQQDQRHLLQDPMLSGDLVGLASTASKAAMEVRHGYDLALTLRRAFTLAVTPPSGPVFVSIPMDLLDEPAPAGDPPVRSPIDWPGAATGVDRAIELLSASERPVVVAGDGVGRDCANDELVTIAERLGATVFHQPMHDYLDFPTTHPLYAGMLPPRNQEIREILQPYDTMLLVGCHAFTPHHYTPGPAVPDGLTVVQIDSDPTEIGRNFAVAAGLVGSIRPTLRALASGLPAAHPQRALLVRESNANRQAYVEARALARYGPAPLDPMAAAHALASGLPADAVLVEEAITVGIHLRGVVRRERPGSYVHTVGGGLGWGIGAAIGTRLGAPNRPVVAALGDGCAMFGLQGLWSAVRYGVPVAFVVFDNGEYRTLKDTLDERRGGPSAGGSYVGLDLRPPSIDWASAARTFGMASVRVESTDELRSQIESVPDLTEPLLIQVPTASP